MPWVSRSTMVDPVRGDVVVDALGRYRCPPGWPRASGEPTDSGAIYYCRYFELAEGVEHLDAPILNPRGDLGYMGFNTFRGDSRTFAVILLAPAADHDLRVQGTNTRGGLPALRSRRSTS